MSSYINITRICRLHTTLYGFQKPQSALSSGLLAPLQHSRALLSPCWMKSNYSASRQFATVYMCNPKLTSPLSNVVNSKYSLDCLKHSNRSILSALQKSSVHQNTLTCHHQQHYLQSRQFSSSAVLHSSFKVPADERKKYVPSDNGLNLAVHAENVYLSWMRNAYLMTIASITISNFVTSPLPGVLAAITIILAGMNMVVGSARFIYLLSYLRQNGHMSKPLSWLQQTGCVLHLCLWYIGALLIFPEFKVIEDELDEFEKGQKETEEIKE